MGETDKFRSFSGW